MNDQMFLPPDASSADFVNTAVALAMQNMATRMEAQQERGVDVGNSFVAVVFTLPEMYALSTMLQKERIPKELYELRKHLKPSNFVTIRQGGQG
jgi:hypothetical protein